MLRAMRGHVVELCSSAGYLALLTVAFQAGDAELFPYIMACIAALAALAWLITFSRSRLVADLPTSRIGSAAQGYAEIEGRATVAADNLIRTPFSGISCVWFRYWLYVRQDDNWREISHYTSDSTIEVTDGSGRCFVDPDGAEIIAPEQRVTKLLEHKHVEHILYAGPIYVLGDFVTVGGSGQSLNLKEDVSALLAEWKRDKTTLIAKFDLDKNGEIDLQEWELARRAAVREVQKQHREIRTQPDVHVMRAPKDQRPYLISNLSPQKLRRQYVFWGYVHILILVLATSAAIWLW